MRRELKAQRVSRLRVVYGYAESHEERIESEGPLRGG